MKKPRLNDPFWRTCLFATLTGVASVQIYLAHHLVHANAAKPPETFEPRFDSYVVQKGDSLWTVCLKAGLKAWQWPRVWAYNPELSNPNWIFPGDVIQFRPTDQKLARRWRDNAATTVDVINTIPPPQPQKQRSHTYRAFAGSYVSPKEFANAGVLTNAMPDSIMLNVNDLVFLTFKPEMPVPKAGDKFVLYRILRTIEHPKSHNNVGYLTEITGIVSVVQIETVDKKSPYVVRARIDKTVREIERGQLVAPLTQDLQVMVHSTPGDRELEGTILDVAGDGAVVAGSQQLVFIDRGSQDGIKLGNELTVLNRGDVYKDETRASKLVETGKLVVVDVKEKTSTCLVVSAEHELEAGDPVRLSAVSY